MAYLGNFDATTVEPSVEFGALPDGDYPVIITDSELANTKTGGQMLKLTMEVIEGVHKGRYLWARLNLVNSNPKAVEIAQRELSAICHAVGCMQISDSSELHGKPMTVKAVYVPPRGEYKESNDIKAWKPYGAVSPTPAPAAQAAARSAPRTAPAATAPAAAKAPPKAPPAAAPVAAPAPGPVSGKPWEKEKKTAAAPTVEAEDIPF